MQRPYSSAVVARMKVSRRGKVSVPDSPSVAEFRQELRRCHQESGMSIRELSSRTGFGPDRLENWVKGSFSVSVPSDPDEFFRMIDLFPSLGPLVEAIYAERAENALDPKTNSEMLEAVRDMQEKSRRTSRVGTRLSNAVPGDKVLLRSGETGVYVSGSDVSLYRCRVLVNGHEKPMFCSEIMRVL